MERRFLGVVDVGDKKIHTKISKVRMEKVKDRDTGKTKKRPVVFFENIDKASDPERDQQRSARNGFRKNSRPGGSMVPSKSLSIPT